MRLLRSKTERVTNSARIPISLERKVWLVNFVSTGEPKHNGRSL